ncbi:MAG: hypothetical protein QOH26_1963 [Actinomycetota bacterium]|nr:hypothetical protein [Actinomycetota bacterium]
MTELSQRIIEIVRDEGPITFARYQALALYDPEAGYYAAGTERSGWGGHYITSAQLDPAFGALWAKGLEQLWGASGTPARWDVIELGPGEGAFAASILGAAHGAFGRALRYTLVERSPQLTARQRELLADHDNVAWVSSADEVPTAEAGVVVANEVLDNQPVHILERKDGAWLEVFVEEQGERLERRLGPPSDARLTDYVGATGAPSQNGSLVELSLDAEALVTRAASLVQRGAVVFVDYGAETAELFGRTAGTVVCYSAAGADDDPLDRPGEKDITSHANWTIARQAVQAAGLAAIGPVPQRDVLIALGLRAMLDDAKEKQDKALAKGRGAEGFRAIARRQALATLADPSGLGGLQVFVGLKGIAHPPFLKEKSGPVARPAL